MILAYIACNCQEQFTRLTIFIYLFIIVLKILKGNKIRHSTCFFDFGVSYVGNNFRFNL